MSARGAFRPEMTSTNFNTSVNKAVITRTSVDFNKPSTMQNTMN